MRVFLTGASGYIGRHVAQELLSRDYQVVGVARGPSQRTQYSEEVEWCYSDLSAFENYWARLESSDIVVHCAMDYSGGTENSQLDRSFLRKMRGFEGHFVYTGNLFSERQAGTSFLQEAPKQDSANWRFQSEADILGSAKAAAVIRLGFVYGGTGSYFWDILSPGTLSALSGASIAEVFWPMIHVRDVATLYASVLDTKATGVFHAFDGRIDKASEIIDSARSVYNAHAVSGRESFDYIDSLLQTSVRTSNVRSLGIGWRPAYSSFSECANRAYLEHAGWSHK